MIDLSCSKALTAQCYIRPFFYADLNAAVVVNDQFRFCVKVQNVTNNRAPLASGTYTSNPNYPSSWRYAGLVGRAFDVSRLRP